MARMSFKKGATPKPGKAAKPGAGMATLSDGTTRGTNPAAPAGRPVNPLAALGAALGGGLAGGAPRPPGLGAPGRGAVAPKLPTRGAPRLAIGQRPKLGARTKAAMAKMPRQPKGVI